MNVNVFYVYFNTYLLYRDVCHPGIKTCVSVSSDVCLLFRHVHCRVNEEADSKTIVNLNGSVDGVHLVGVLVITEFNENVILRY